MGIPLSISAGLFAGSSQLAGGFAGAVSAVMDIHVLDAAMTAGGMGDSALAAMVGAYREALTSGNHGAAENLGLAIRDEIEKESEALNRVLARIPQELMGAARFRETVHAENAFVGGIHLIQRDSRLRGRSRYGAADARLLHAGMTTSETVIPQPGIVIPRPDRGIQMTMSGQGRESSPPAEAGQGGGNDARANGSKKKLPRNVEWRSGNYTREEFLAAAKRYRGNRRKMAEDLGITPEAVSEKIIYSDDQDLIPYLTEKGIPGFKQPGVMKMLYAGWKPAAEIASVLDEPGMTISAAAKRLGYKEAGGLRGRIRNDSELSGYKHMIDGRFDNTNPERRMALIAARKKSAGEKHAKKKIAAGQIAKNDAAAVQARTSAQVVSDLPAAEENANGDRLKLLREIALGRKVKT